jgi:2-C-methyl-D-erythritol 4-phosphate cytidylyltransferase
MWVKPEPLQREAWAIIPAGGTGSRFSGEENKLLTPLAGVPVLVRTLRAVLSAPSIQGVVLVCHPQHQSQYQALLKAWLPDAPILYTAGGGTRRDSVYQGLLALPAQASIVAVHDAARPLIASQLIEQAVCVIREGHAGALVALSIQDTVKQVSPHTLVIESTLDRTVLWRAQTPQCFDKILLLQAHQQVSKEHAVTDDVQLMELAGLGPVLIVPGEERNLKITTPTDVVLAEVFLQADDCALPLL